MKLYHTPNSCSLGIYILLEEIGKPYELAKVDFAAREQHSDAYKALNPKSKVPALQLDDGAILTEWPAIAFHLASSFPNAKLMPANPLQQARAFEITDYVVATIHMQGFSRIARPENFAFDEGDFEKVGQRGREIMTRGFEVLADRIVGPYVLGEFSFADAALFYVEHWAVNRAGLSLPDKCRQHLETMLARPSVQTMLQRDNITAKAA
ncbi:MAG: glutathione S-transferase N-terminal domain-containing protein [Mesorhizobium sp.]